MDHNSQQQSRNPPRLPSERETLQSEGVEMKQARPNPAVNRTAAGTLPPDSGRLVRRCRLLWC
jgi:hypothetical protein